MDQEYRFKIDGGYSPETLPMERLAVYAGELAKLLGETPSVHLDRVDDGSAVLVARVDSVARVRVRERVGGLRDGTAIDEVRRAFEALDQQLARDNAVGSLTSDRTGKIIDFPGRERPQPITYGPIKQECTLTGKIIRIGGADHSVHIWLKAAACTYSQIETTEEVAKRLAIYLFDTVVRLRGIGTWFRTEDESWQLRRFNLKSFDVLEDNDLLETFSHLRNIDGNDWANDPNPIATLMALRHDGDAH